MCQVNVEDRQGDRHVQVVGDVGMDTLAQFRHDLWNAAHGGDGALTIDASRVGYTFGAALSVFVELQEKLGQAGREVRILDPPPRLRDLLMLTELDRIMPVVESKLQST